MASYGIHNGIHNGMTHDGRMVSTSVWKGGNEVFVKITLCSALSRRVTLFLKHDVYKCKRERERERERERNRAECFWIYRTNLNFNRRSQHCKYFASDMCFFGSKQKNIFQRLSSLHSLARRPPNGSQIRTTLLTHATERSAKHPKNQKASRSWIKRWNGKKKKTKILKCCFPRGRR